MLDIDLPSPDTMQTDTPLSLFGVPLPARIFLLLLSGCLLFLFAASTDRAAAQNSDVIVFADFEDQDANNERWFAYGSATASVAEDQGDVPPENGGSYSLELTFDGTGGGVGSSGVTGIPVNVDPDVTGLTNPYLNFYVKADAPSPFGVQLDIKEDANGDGSNDSGDDVFRYRVLTIEPSSEYQLISLPLSAFEDVDGRGDGTLDAGDQLVIQPEGYSGSEITINADYFTYSSGPFNPQPDPVAVFEDFETEGANDENCGPYGSASVSQTDQTPETNGGSFALQVDMSGSSGGVTCQPSDVLDVTQAQNAYVNFYVQSEASSPFNLQIDVKDQDDDNFRFRVYRVEPVDGYRLVSLPLSAFNVQAAPGNGTLDMAFNFLLQPENFGSSLTFRVDYFTITGATALPVELATFTGASDGRDAVLEWQTSSETNNAGFSVMHAAPGRTDYREAAFVDGQGTTTEANRYEYRVSGLKPGTHRFRLRQVDLDGTTSASKPVTVQIRSDQATLVPAGANPFRSSTRVEFSVATDGYAQVGLYDVMGRRVRTLYDGQLSAGRTADAVIDASGLAPGTYFVRLQANGTTKTRRLTLVE
jgi:hypothetical protein